MDNYRVCGMKWLLLLNGFMDNVFYLLATIGVLLALQCPGRPIRPFQLENFRTLLLLRGQMLERGRRRAVAGVGGVQTVPNEEVRMPRPVPDARHLPGVAVPLDGDQRIGLGGETKQSF